MLPYNGPARYIQHLPASVTDEWVTDCTINGFVTFIFGCLGRSGRSLRLFQILWNALKSAKVMHGRASRVIRCALRIGRDKD